MLAVAGNKRVLGGMQRCADRSANALKYRESDSETWTIKYSRDTSMSYTDQSAQCRVKSNTNETQEDSLPVTRHFPRKCSP